MKRKSFVGDQSLRDPLNRRRRVAGPSSRTERKDHLGKGFKVCVLFPATGLWVKEIRFTGVYVYIINFLPVPPQPGFLVTPSEYPTSPRQVSTGRTRRHTRTVTVAERPTLTRYCSGGTRSHRTSSPCHYHGRGVPTTVPIYSIMYVLRLVVDRTPLTSCSPSIAHLQWTDGGTPRLRVNSSGWSTPSLQGSGVRVGVETRLWRDLVTGVRWDGKSYSGPVGGSTDKRRLWAVVETFVDVSRRTERDVSGLQTRRTPERKGRRGSSSHPRESYNPVCRH